MPPLQQPNPAEPRDGSDAVGSDFVERRIVVLRGQRVMPGTHLATLYGIPTKVLMQAVRRNIERFPGDFMIQITEEEVEALKGIFPLESSATCSPEGSCSRSQIVTLDGGILTASWGSAGAPRAACSAGA